MSPHKSVLLNEVSELFSGINGTFLDCTLGYGGHSYEILKTNKNVNLIACDRDDEAIKFSEKKLEEFKDRVKIYKSNFSNLIKILNTQEIKNIRGILADIGVSSLQLDKDDRGFSINSQTLDMRMDKSSNLSAYNVVNTYSKDDLAKIFFEYAELKNAKFLAEKIVNERKNAPITTAKQLSNLIGSKKIGNRAINPAILAFQAIRIEVNNELGELKELLNSIKTANLNDCVVCIISFHSLEDRIVKNTFKEWATSCICPPNALRCECGNNHALGKLVTKKAITPSKAEILENSRSSCAKLRAFRIKQ
ncbi:16S rRNA (cytosine(1402)-N(4))-methyltransferase RsmH [Campylobacter mucosalis]|uniref:16S rRNA (cytosine(1402)-N(4))-methyltransferase RsmH n=1 Tax=Campylobacter mucosalis TaxID=202 RepID=UPI003D2DF47C